MGLFATPWTNPPGSTVHGISQARILEWVAILFSRGSSDLGIEPKSPALQVESLPSEPPGKPSPFSRGVFFSICNLISPFEKQKFKAFALTPPEIFRSLHQEFSRALFSKIYYKKMIAGFCMPQCWILRLCLRRKHNIYILSSLT